MSARGYPASWPYRPSLEQARTAVCAAFGLSKTSTTELDAMLWELLDPAQQGIPVAELSQRYGYRELDFKTIGLDWRMEDPDRY